MASETILRCLNSNNIKYKTSLDKDEQNAPKRNKIKCRNCSPLIFQRHFRSTTKKSTAITKSMKDSKWIWKHFAVIKKQILEQLRSAKGMEMKIWLLMKMKEIVELRNLGRAQLESCRSRRQFHELFSSENGCGNKKAASVIALNSWADISYVCKHAKDNIFYSQKCSASLHTSLNYLCTTRNCIDSDFLKKYHSLIYGREVKVSKPKENYGKPLCKINGQSLIFQERFFEVETKVKVEQVAPEMDGKYDEDGLTQENQQIFGNQKENLQKIGKHIGRRQKRLAKVKRKFIRSRELEAAVKQRRLRQASGKKNREIIVSAIKRYWKARNHSEKSKESLKFNQKLQNELEQKLTYRANTQLKQSRKRRMIVRQIQKFWAFQNKVKLESGKIDAYKVEQNNIKRKRVRKHKKKVNKSGYVRDIHEISHEENINRKANNQATNDDSNKRSRKRDIANKSLVRYNRDILLCAVYQLWVQKGVISSNESCFEAQLHYKDYDNQGYGMANAKRSSRRKKKK